MTPIAVAIHPEGENAVFSNATTHVMIEDEAGGGFIVLRQFGDDAKPGEVRLEMGELRVIAQQAQKLLAAYEKAHT